MRRIEFIGANGVGKTTLLKQTIELLESDCLEQTQARAELAWRQFDESGLARKWISQLKWRAMARRPRRIKSQRNQALQQALASDNPELIGFCDLVLRIVTDSLLTIMQKQRVLSWFYDALYDALYFDASDCCTGALCDESIGLKTLMIAMLASSQAEAERLFELMPLPFAVVKVTGSEERIYRRLMQRQEARPFVPLPYFHGLDEQATRSQLKRMNALAELGCGVLARRGALVIDIDVCRGSLETQAQHVKTKLDKYLYSQEAAYA